MAGAPVALGRGCNCTALVRSLRAAPRALLAPRPDAAPACLRRVVPAASLRLPADAQRPPQPSAHVRRRRAAALPRTAATPAAAAGSRREPRDALDALVEVAMLAACTGLAYHLSSTFKLEAYLGAFFPLPAVLSAARWRGGVAVKTTVATTLLLLLLGGPLRASSYLLLHGSLGLAMGLLWQRRLSWLITVPCSALVRTAGVFGSLFMSSLLMRENVLALIMAQVCALLDQLGAAVGLAATPESQWVYVLAFVLIAVNSLCYATLLHILYALLLGRMSGANEDFGAAPLFVRRALRPGFA